MKRQIPAYETGAWPEGQVLLLAEAAAYLGVSKKTVNRYVSRGLLTVWKNQVNGKVYFDKVQVMTLLGSRPKLVDKQNVAYCRVTATFSATPGNSAQARVDRQAERVVRYCAGSGIRLDRVIKDIRPACLLRSTASCSELLEMVFRKEIGILVIETPDRISRWDGQDIFEEFLRWHGVVLHVINPTLAMQEYKDEAKDDLAALLYQTKVLMGDG